MENSKNKKWQSNRLLFFGILLFLLGLIMGFFIPLMTNPRMGLTAHLEGVMNGMFIVIIGIIWSKIIVNERWLTFTFWLTIYSSFANFLAVTIAAITGAGKMLPIAGGQEGTPIIEGIISFLLISLALAIIFACVVVLIGLWRYVKQTDEMSNP
jgi:(hydroxyamino)benzene mutase